MKIKKTVNHGTVRWRVNDSIVGKRQRRFFESKEEAESFMRLRKADQRAFGNHFTTIPPAERIIIGYHLDRLRKLGWNLPDAVDFIERQGKKPQSISLGVVADEFLAAIYLLEWLLSDDKEKKPESAPSMPVRPALVIPSASGGNSPQNRIIPPVSDGKSNVTPAPSASASAIVPASSAPAAPRIPVPPPSVIPVVKVQPEIPAPARKKFITREDAAKIFNGGRGFTRKSAVSALKALGFGKTAAYEALAINGRFAPWLQFAPDGIITWKG